MNMSVPDGNVLIENIFISDEIMQEHITNIKEVGRHYAKYRDYR